MFDRVHTPNFVGLITNALKCICFVSHIRISKKMLYVIVDAFIQNFRFCCLQDTRLLEFDCVYRDEECSTTRMLPMRWLFHVYINFMFSVITKMPKRYKVMFSQPLIETDRTKRYIGFHKVIDVCTNIYKKCDENCIKCLWDLV